MTEALWRKCHDLQSLLEFLASRASERKLRLFAMACCRRVHEHLTKRGREIIEVGERHADQPTFDEALQRALTASHGVYAFSSHPHAGEAVQATALPSLRNTVGIVAQEVSAHVRTFASDNALQRSFEGLASAEEWRSNAGFRKALFSQSIPAHRSAEAGEREFQLAAVRCIFGNPFRSEHAEQAWLDWQDGTVPKLAQAAYDERELPSGQLDRARLAVLADALEEAGCANEDILTHLRGPGPHVRGCWAVDLLLGKE